MAAPIYLADTSVHIWRSRDSGVRRRYETLLAEGRLAVCEMTALECLNGVADPKRYELLWGALHGHRWMEVTSQAMERALAVHREVASTSQHRGFSLPDLIIAATADVHGATVLHYDADFDRIAGVTGQPVEWVAAQGSL